MSIKILLETFSPMYPNQSTLMSSVGPKVLLRIAEWSSCEDLVVIVLEFLIFFFYLRRCGNSFKYTIITLLMIL